MKERTEKQTIRPDDVGKLEDVLGKDDPVFSHGGDTTPTEEGQRSRDLEEVAGQHTPRPWEDTPSREFAYGLGVADTEDRYAGLVAALEGLYSFASHIGAEAWNGTMGDDGQGHDEGEIRAQTAIDTARKALADARGDRGRTATS